MDFEDKSIEEEEQDASTQFWQLQKNKLNDLEDHMEEIGNSLPVFRFIGAN